MSTWEDHIKLIYDVMEFHMQDGGYLDEIDPDAHSDEEYYYSSDHDDKIVQLRIELGERVAQLLEERTSTDSTTEMLVQLGVLDFPLDMMDDYIDDYIDSDKRSALKDNIRSFRKENGQS